MTEHQNLTDYAKKADLNAKADKTYVDNNFYDRASVDVELKVKADKTYVDGELAGKADTFEVAKKADKSYVDTKLEGKQPVGDYALKSDVGGIKKTVLLDHTLTSNEAGNTIVTLALNNVDKLVTAKMLLIQVYHKLNNVNVTARQYNNRVHLKDSNNLAYDVRIGIFGSNNNVVKNLAFCSGVTFINDKGIGESQKSFFSDFNGVASFYNETTNNYNVLPKTSGSGAFPPAENLKKFPPYMSFDLRNLKFEEGTNFYVEAWE